MQYGVDQNLLFSILSDSSIHPAGYDGAITPFVFGCIRILAIGGAGELITIRTTLNQGNRPVKPCGRTGRLELELQRSVRNHDQSLRVTPTRAVIRQNQIGLPNCFGDAF